MKKLFFCFLLAGCCGGSEDKNIVTFRATEVECLKSKNVKNPDCVAMLDLFVDCAHAAIPGTGTSVILAAAAAGTNAQRMAARERERRRESCSKHPTLQVCTEWRVMGEAL